MPHVNNLISPTGFIDLLNGRAVSIAMRRDGDTRDATVQVNPPILAADPSFLDAMQVAINRRRSQLSQQAEEQIARYPNGTVGALTEDQLDQMAEEANRQFDFIERLDAMTQLTNSRKDRDHCDHNNDD